MKQTIVSILCMLACLTGNAQTVTFDISGGYCIPLAGGTEPIERKVGTGTTFPYYYTTYASVRKKSYGQGGSLALNLNWYSKKSIGFGVKVNFLIGGSAPYTINVYDGSNVEFSTYRDKPFAFQFIPHACF
ncbi:MAG TPA: hypothetical protein VK154_12415, partial [Chitinophagales bacterium]|nr:hypothetical protein [Chitinophagales bacterium]